MTTGAPLPTPAQQQDSNTRWYLDLLVDDMKPAQRPDCGRWVPLVEMAEDAYNSSRNGNRAKIVAELLNSLIRTEKFPGLEALLEGKETTDIPPALPTKEEDAETSNMPALPESARVPEGLLSAGACVWLDEYNRYSQLVSPEGYEDFHEACGLWVLSTIAGRRLKIPFSKKQYTPLMVILVADTTMYAKSETADVGVNVLQAAGLRWLLGSDETTPQKLLTDMAGTLPKNYGDLDADHQFLEQRAIAMSAQRGWRYDEFGQLVKAMSKEGGVMQDLKGLLLKLDACSDQYSYSTQSRGKELIEKPYLSLLGCMTPRNISSSAKTGADFWSDGFWARFAFITPPADTSKDSPFTLGEIPVWYELSRPLRDWHERLGVPTVSVVEKKDDKSGKILSYTPVRGELPETEIKFGEGVYDAWVRYRSALKKIATSAEHRDVRGSYGRLPIKAIRVAALLASLENNNRIEMRHWAKAQEIAERWRKSLHELYSQINTAQDEPSYAKKVEDEVLRVVRKLEDQGKPPTIRDLSRYLTRVDAGKIKMSVVDLVRAERLAEDKSGKSPRYTINEES